MAVIPAAGYEFTRNALYRIVIVIRVVVIEWGAQTMAPLI